MPDILILRNRNFRLLFSAAGIANLGDGVGALALPWLATLLTRDPFLIAAVGAAQRLPWFLLAIPAGVLIDRSDRRAMMVRADVFRTIIAFAIVALILSGGGAPPAGPAPILALAGLAFLLGCAEVLRDNAAQTALPSVVDRADLEAANGQIWSVERIAGSFVGPPLAGLLIALAVPVPFAFSALTFALAAWIVWCMALPRRAPVARLPRFLHDLREGVAWLLANRLILQLALMLGVLNLIAAMAEAALTLYAQQVLGLTAVGYGLLLTAAAAGGVAGGLSGPALARRFGAGRVVLLALVLFPVPYAVFWLGHSPALAAVALFAETSAGLMWNVVTVSLRQRLIPDRLLGRVNSLYRFFGWGMMPIGALLGGAVVTLAEPSLGREAALRLVYLVATAGMGGMLAYGAAFLRLDGVGR